MFKRGRVSADLHNRALFRRLMDRQNLTLDELAQDIGCSAKYLSNIHSGYQDRCSLNLARKIEERLGCPDQLFVPVASTRSVDKTDTEDATAGAA